MVNLTPTGDQDLELDQLGRTAVVPRVHTSDDAKQVASAYLARRYPGSLQGEISVLKLAERWLAQAPVAPRDDDGPEGQVVLVINRYGFVEEVGRTSVARQSVHRCLAGLKAMAPAVGATGEA